MLALVGCSWKRKTATHFKSQLASPCLAHGDLRGPHEKSSHSPRTHGAFGVGAAVSEVSGAVALGRTAWACPGRGGHDGWPMPRLNLPLRCSSRQQGPRGQGGLMQHKGVKGAKRSPRGPTLRTEVPGHSNLQGRA
jgi:hypothetical protein